MAGTFGAFVKVKKKFAPIKLGDQQQLHKTIRPEKLQDEATLATHQAAFTNMVSDSVRPSSRRTLKDHTSARRNLLDYEISSHESQESH